MNGYTTIALAQIKQGTNPRKTFSEKSLRELAQSIKEHGVIEPIIVEEDAGGSYVLVAGERRLRAARLAELTDIPAIVRERSNHNGRERFILSIVENDQREDMNPMDRAEAYHELFTAHGMSVRNIARYVGKAENQVRDYIELVKLDEPIKAYIRKGWWKDARLAKALLAIPNVDLRCELAGHLYDNAVSLQGCLKACKRALDEMHMPKRGRGRPAMLKADKVERPALEMADNPEAQKPRKWDMLRQVGKVPPWDAVVASAGAVCDGCPLRQIASHTTCRECGAVELLKKLMEAAQ